MQTWADKEAHPEPAGWKDGVCKACVKTAERREAGKPEAKGFNGRPADETAKRKRQKSGGRPEVPPLTDTQREQAETLMREGKSNREVVETTGGGADRVAELRRELGLPKPQVIKGERNQAAAARYFAEHPDASFRQAVAATGLPKGAVFVANRERRKAAAA